MNARNRVVIQVQTTLLRPTIYIENNRIDSPNLDRALRLKSNARRGGTIENIYVRNVQVGRVSEALLTIDFLYEEGAHGDFPPTARNIVIENVTTRAAPRLFYILGFKGATIEGIRVRQQPHRERDRDRDHRTRREDRARQRHGVARRAPKKLEQSAARRMIERAALVVRPGSLRLGSDAALTRDIPKTHAKLI